MSTNQILPTYLFYNRGTRAAKTLEGTRTAHNETASAAAQAAARSLGDLTHKVYVRADRDGATSDEFLILDVWNNLEGFKQFFANTVSRSKLLNQRDQVLWSPAEGFYSYHLQAPYGKNERFVAIVRGAVHSRAEAQTLHNDFVARQVGQAHVAGAVSHEAYFRINEPEAPESLEFLAQDVWTDSSGMAQYYQGAEFQNSLQKLFATAPSISTWTHPAGDWNEW